MIIFDLDGTLADCDHRQYLVDIEKALDKGFLPAHKVFGRSFSNDENRNIYHPTTHEKWKPDWKSFYESCSEDQPNEAIIKVYKSLMVHYDIQIWSGRCESVRDKTLDWLHTHLDLDFYSDNCCPILKMRPIGDSTPDDQLKESWLDERIKYCEDTRPNGLIFNNPSDIEMVFDDRQKVVDMWRRRGITCLQVAPGDF